MLEPPSVGFVVSPNLKNVHVLPEAYSPAAFVVKPGNLAHSSRSWTHSWVVGFHVKPRLVPPEIESVGLMRALT